jgi:hypothetical protein
VFSKEEGVKGRKQREGGENLSVLLETEWRIGWEGWSQFSIVNSRSDESAFNSMLDSLYLGQNEEIVPV